MADSPLDFIAIGDCTVDEFIKLKDAHVHCDINDENCTISMSWGDKIPYEFSVLVPGVGNAANAAVSAARLGLSTGFVSNVGSDRYGEEILDVFKKERVDPRYVRVNEKLATNHDYVLWYDAERTILVKHEDYPYAMPEGMAPPKWFYLSSAGRSEPFHAEVAAWVAAHPSAKLAFQPSTFEMSMGTEKLADLYQATELVACNKEEAERILGLPETPMKALLEKMHALGPKIVLITDGPNGASVSDGTKRLRIPMYPDPKAPVDRTGAGDATTSTFVVALALGLPLEEALAWGPVNSMSVVQDIGAQKGLLSRDALERFLAAAPAEYRVSAF
ncbi:MAG: carbohydrate kinase family protein [Patescibacteria group bacterium]|nr:carbohydrate kinase family protein [Patescibacteria group bacterium]